jgi:hypothetical protein
MVDAGGDLRIDFGEAIACADAIGSGSVNLLRLFRASLGTPLRAPRADKVRDVQALRFGKAWATHTREDFLTDLGNELI